MLIDTELAFAMAGTTLEWRPGLGSGWNQHDLGSGGPVDGPEPRAPPAPPKQCGNYAPAGGSETVLNMISAAVYPT